MLQDMLDEARSGDLQEVFAVYRGADPYDYGCAYNTSNLDDMLFQVRTETMMAALGHDKDTPQ